MAASCSGGICGTAKRPHRAPQLPFAVGVRILEARKIDCAAPVVGQTKRIRRELRSCRTTSGVWVEGNRLTLPDMRQAARPTVNR